MEINRVQDAAPVLERTATQKAYCQREYFQAAALLALWSLLLINEGTVRFIRSEPSSNLLSGLRPPRILPFLASLAELLYASSALFVSIAALLLNSYSHSFTRLFIIVQATLSSFVFIVFVIILPAFRAASLVQPIIPQLTMAESRVLIVLGILTSTSFCLALQGGHYLFLSRLASTATGTPSQCSRLSSRRGAIFWNGNMALAGLWTTLTGLLLVVRIRGTGTDNVVQPSSPNIGKLPGMATLVGLLMLTWGVIGMAVASGGRRRSIAVYVSMAIVVYLLLFTNYSMVQMATLPLQDFAAYAATHAALVLAITFLGPYFMVKQRDER